MDNFINCVRVAIDFRRNLTLRKLATLPANVTHADHCLALLSITTAFADNEKIYQNYNLCWHLSFVNHPIQNDQCDGKETVRVKRFKKPRIQSTCYIFCFLWVSFHYLPIRVWVCVCVCARPCDSHYFGCPNQQDRIVELSQMHTFYNWPIYSPFASIQNGRVVIPRYVYYDYGACDKRTRGHTILAKSTRWRSHGADNVCACVCVRVRLSVKRERGEATTSNGRNKKKNDQPKF